MAAAGAWAFDVEGGGKCLSGFRATVAERAATSD